MTDKQARPAKGFTKYGIELDDLVTIRGHEMQCASYSDAGVVLRSANDNGPRRTTAYDWKTISNMIRYGHLDVERGYYSERSAIERARNTKSFELDPEKVLRAKMVAEFIAQEADDPDWSSEKCHRSDEDILRFYAVFKADREHETLVEEARVSIIKKGKKKLFVGPRQFRRLIQRFEESMLSPASMADRYPGGGSPGSTLNKEDLDLVLKFVATARTPDRPTVKSAWQAMQDESEERIVNGLPGYRTISLSTFQRLHSESSDFLNDVGGSDTNHPIERQYLFRQKGLKVTRPLEIVEMDEHLVHLMTMLVKNRVWDHLHPEAQVKIERLGRVWLSVALDAYSRSIVGLKILKGAPDADAAVATLAMVAQRKDKLSALLGAQTRWPQCGTPEWIHTDAGAGYVSNKFELAVMMFTGRHRIPPSKHPHLRGRIERFFRTLNQRYIHLFSGQTFSNPLLKGEYDPEKYAHVTDEEFADLIGRLIVDCYHNTRHRSLGMTPLEAWERGSQFANGSIMPPPNGHKYREIFGSTLKRSIGNNGIEIAGNIYSSPDLLDIRKKWFRAKLWVRLNEDDISIISVKHRRTNHWVDVPAVFDGLKGVTLDEWHETIRYIDRHLGKKKVHTQDVVRQALKAAREIIALSKKRPGILVHNSLENKIEQIEGKESASFKYSQPQNYDYARYDDGIDHEDDYEDDENAAVGRMRVNLDEAASFERELPVLQTGGNPFNPGVGQQYDRSGFTSAEAQETPKASKADKVTIRQAAQSKPPSTKSDSSATSQTDVAAIPVTAPGSEGMKAKKTIRITKVKKDNGQ